MGFLDNLLKAVEDGAIEKKLGGAVDKIESGLKKLEDNAEKAAAVPGKVLDTAEERAKHISSAADELKTE